MESSYFKHKIKSKGIPVIIGWVIIGVIGAAAFAFLFGYFVMLLWNWIMPGLFGLAMIGYWKAAGIVLLARLIFGGFGHPNHKHKHEDHGHFKSRKFSKHSKSRKCGKKFSKWSFYDDYWKEEGKQAFNDYIDRKKSDDDLIEDADIEDDNKPDITDESKKED